MTTVGPDPARMSLLDRLAGAQIVALGRVLGVAERFADPDAPDSQEFVLLDVELRQPLRGETPERIQVRSAVGQADERRGWKLPYDEGEDVLFVLAPDEGGEANRYGVQHASAFRVRDDAVELPEGVDPGPLRDKEEEPVTIPGIAKLLSRLDAERERHDALMRETEGEDYFEQPPGEVEEVPSEKDRHREAERAREESGPREGGPGARWDFGEE